VTGESQLAEGVRGISHNPGNGGVVGICDKENGIGVYGFCDDGSRNLVGTGVFGESSQGQGVHGLAASGIGVEGESKSGPGVVGRTLNGNGVEGRSASGGAGVIGFSTAGDTGVGVHGLSSGAQYPFKRYPPFTFVGVWGEVNSSQGEIFDFGFGSHVGVFGDGGPKGIGVYGRGGGYPEVPDALVGYFEGSCQIRDNLTKGGGGFRIDHPLEPAKKLLNHIIC